MGRSGASGAARSVSAGCALLLALSPLPSALAEWAPFAASWHAWDTPTAALLGAAALASGWLIDRGGASAVTLGRAAVLGAAGYAALRVCAYVVPGAPPPPSAMAVVAPAVVITATSLAGFGAGRAISAVWRATTPAPAGGAQDLGGTAVARGRRWRRRSRA